MLAKPGTSAIYCIVSIHVLSLIINYQQSATAEQRRARKLCQHLIQKNPKPPSRTTKMNPYGTLPPKGLGPLEEDQSTKAAILRLPGDLKRLGSVGSKARLLAAHQFKWVVVKIKVPFWVRIIIGTQKGTFDNHPYRNLNN